MRRERLNRNDIDLINTVPITLYHGTDKKLLDYSEKERSEIQKLCTQISDYCYYRFLDDGLSIFSLSNYKTKRGLEIGDCWSQFLSAFQKYDSRKKNSTLYQYGVLYLTGDRKKAEVYARNSFIMGEQGIVAYWLYVAASKVWDLKRTSQDLVGMFESFESLTTKPSIPIVLTFIDIPKDDLLSERGEEIEWEALGNIITGLSYRLIPGSTCIANGTVEYL
jgi:hypothetical protein